MTEPTLIFLPGLGDDHRLFKHQLEAFPGSIAVDWIDPKPGESLEEYAVRLARSLPKPTGRIIVCGLSLGGMVAPYIARHLEATFCIRLATVRDRAEFPIRYYPAWLLMRACPALSWTILSGARLAARGFLVLSPLWRRRFDLDTLRAFVGTRTSTLFRLTRMMLDWAYRRRDSVESGPTDPCPGLQIHGTRDLLLPIRRTRPDIRIDHAGHLLSLSHPNEINRIIGKILEKIDETHD